jgi:AcrR family transcriptional regulator
MPEVRPRQRLPLAERRRIILDAATEVVAEHGAEAASISQIADRSGISRPIVYDHFPTKQHLILALIEMHHETLMEVLRTTATGPHLSRAIFRRLLVAYLHQVDADPGGWRILCLERSHDVAIAEVQRRTAAEVNGVVAQMFDPSRPLKERLMVVEAARAAVNAFAELRQQDSTIEVETLADAGVSLLWEGLRRF